MWNRSQSHYLWCESLFLFDLHTWVCQFFPLAYSLKLWFADNEKLKLFPPFTASSRRHCTSDNGRSRGSRSCDKNDEWSHVRQSEISSRDVGWKVQIQVSYKLIIDLSQIDLLLNILQNWWIRHRSKRETSKVGHLLGGRGGEREGRRGKCGSVWGRINNN